MKKILLLIIIPITAPNAIYEKPMWLLDDVEVQVTETYEQEILRVLQQEGVSEMMSNIILAQAKHESGNFTSAIFEENWNPFGMKQARKRKTTCVGTSRGHGVYLSLTDAVLDYVLYMKAREIPFDVENIAEYVTSLKKKGYFEDDYNNYVRNVKRHHNI